LTAAYAHSESPSAKEAPWLWVYAPTNFLVNDNVDRLIELMARAKKAGYTSAVVTDAKFGRLADRNGDRPPRYFENLRRQNRRRTGP
jgi:hypothetical protein